MWISVEQQEPPEDIEFQGWFIYEGDSETGFWEPRCKDRGDGIVCLYGRIDYDTDGWDCGLTHLTLTHWAEQPESPQDDKE